MSGAWVFVCGASGAGKDSVMAWAQQRLAKRPDIVFSRRVVTREAQPGADDIAVTLAQFDALRLSGGLSWHWQAHDLRYGIDAHYATAVQEGNVVVVNGSREHVQSLAPGADIRVVQIMAEPQQLANRLAQRGRDDPQAVLSRLSRNVRFDGLRTHHTIYNQGALAEAGQQLLAYLTDGLNTTGPNYPLSA
jgi:phosphonate metabolism protein PhnN/1,5-bisphosphokinase (PRPP-forming)